MTTQRNGRRTYTRHGMSALMVRVKLRGIQAIDRRSAPARALLAWRRELLEHLGGAEHATAAQRLLVDKAVNAELLIGHGMAYLLERASLVNRRRHAFLPLVEQIQRLADSQARILVQLGLERRPPRAPDLSTYRWGSGQGAAPAAAPEAAP